MRRFNPLFLVALLSFLMLFACKDDDDKDEKKAIRFAVIADPHLYATELGTSGPDFEAYIEEQVKMLKHSEVIFEEAIRLLMEMDPRPEFLLIPGDLTKDGEEESHLKMAGLPRGGQGFRNRRFCGPRQS